MTNEERLAAYLARPARRRRRTATWSTSHPGQHDGCTLSGAHGHWWPVTGRQRRRLARHVGRSVRPAGE